MHDTVFNLVYMLLLKALSLLPPTVIDRICRWEAVIPWPGQHEIVAALAVRLGYSGPDARAILARARVNQHCSQIDAVGWSRARSRYPIHVQLVGRHHLQEAAALERGVILALPHTSALCAALWPAQRIGAALGYQIHSFGRDAPPERALATRALEYSDPAQGRTRAALEMLTALRSGAIVATAIDHPRGQGKMFALHRRWLTRRFLGRRFAFSTGVSILARRAQSPILPAIPLRSGPAQYSLRLLPMLAPPETPREEAGVMHRLLDVLEAVVREQPDQYVPWFYSLPPLQICGDLAHGDREESTRR